jgi:hypothetical protein
MLKLVLKAIPPMAGLLLLFLALVFGAMASFGGKCLELVAATATTPAVTDCVSAGGGVVFWLATAALTVLGLGALLVKRS